MRISDLRKNGCFRGYSLSRWTPTSPGRYEHLKPLLTSGCDSDPVFYLQQGHLPTHMRSLRLSRHSDQRVVRHTHSQLRHTLVTAAVILAFSLSVTCFILSLYYWRVKDDSIRHNALDDPKSSGITPAQSTGERNQTLHKTENKIKLLKPQKGNPTIKYRDSRLRCSAVTCPAYSAFRFRSTCFRGVCQCNGEHYQQNTCLPKYGDCLIQEKSLSSVTAFTKGKQPVVFSCRSPADVAQRVHVISSFGNYGSNETRVEISGNSSVANPVTLVLSNYQKIHWRIVLQGTIVRQIYLVSYHQLRRSTVRVETEPGMPPPPIHKLFSQVGYGDDRHGGHTVTLLRTVNSRVGHVTSFNGADMADRWTVDLKTL